MARLWSCGFELNSLTDQVELASSQQGDLFGGNVNTDFSITSSAPISGNYSLRVHPVSSIETEIWNDFTATEIRGKVYYRFNLKLLSYPVAAFKILQPQSGGIFAGCLEINESGVLLVRCADDASSTGNIPSPLQLNTVYTIEFMVDTSLYDAGAGEVTSIAYEGRCSGFSPFGIGNFNATGLGVTGQRSLEIINAHAVSNSFDLYIDDIAVNDTTGSFQNSWAGAGKIIHLRGNNAGDFTTWTASSGPNNFDRVNEITPDDASTYVQDATLNNSDMYTLAPSGISALDTVNLVQVGVRFRNDIADTTAAFRVQLEKTSGGTILQSSSIVPNSTTWKTNATTIPLTYPLITYQDPDGNNWTKTTIDSMQIGQKTIVAHTNKNQVSTIWALVEYTPPVYPGKMIVQGIAPQPLIRNTITVF